MTWWPADWGSILYPEAPIMELVVRVSSIYLVLFVLLRVVPKRELGRFAVTDLLVLLLLATSVRLGLTGRHYTVGDSLITAVLLVGWDRFMNWLAFRVRPLREFMRQDPLPVVEDGRILWKNARRELLTEGDIYEKLREQGIESLDRVARAYVEADGRVSVIERDD